MNTCCSEPNLKGLHMLLHRDCMDETMESKASGVAVNSFTVEVLAKRASAASEA